MAPKKDTVPKKIIKVVKLPKLDKFITEDPLNHNTKQLSLVTVVRFFFLRPLHNYLKTPPSRMTANSWPKS